jgi:hypothetical protein
MLENLVSRVAHTEIYQTCIFYHHLVSFHLLIFILILDSNWYSIMLLRCFQTMLTSVQLAESITEYAA